MNASQLEANLQDLAERICRRGLSVPAVFFLELYKPMVALWRAMAVVGAPFLFFLGGKGLNDSLLRVLESRENIERLIVLIEERSAVERKAA
jgi:hypothetical protein